MRYYLTLSKDNIAKQKEELTVLKQASIQCNTEMKTTFSSIQQEITKSISGFTARFGQQQKELQEIKKAKDEIDVQGMNNQIHQLQNKVQQLRKVENDSRDLQLKYNRAELELQGTYTVRVVIANVG